MRYPGKRSAIALFAFLLLSPFGQAEDTAKTSASDHLKTANQILNELRLLDAVIGQYAAENKMQPGDQVAPIELRLYIKRNEDASLYQALGDPSGPKDILGNPYGPLIVGSHPKLNPATFRTLSDVATRKFWQPFLAE